MQALFQRFVLIMVLAGLLAGCGFHLRNSDALVAHAPVRIDGLARYDSLHKRLEEALTASGVSLASSPETAKTVMKIRDLGENQQVITVDSRGKATEYMLIRKVRVSLVTPAGRVLVGCAFSAGSGERAPGRRSHRHRANRRGWFKLRFGF